ncbi:hypothetical protein PGTUg99_023146 [Puccinia graminis f. sp. tritici]|uniref:Uncharacterized protein n=1 Tax=Puccinia graminis f. sp. tritici TaxID=56615 RepID=A0A5B0RFD3_PUCGR|nr:hypothetical protein PGTUg99_023146 [Puccinia graminis f. sp. tritici]
MIVQPGSIFGGLFPANRTGSLTPKFINRSLPRGPWIRGQVGRWRRSRAMIAVGHGPDWL